VIRKLSQQSATTILEALVSNGLITQDQILQTLMSNPSTEMKRAVDFVHRLFCTKKHDKGDTESGFTGLCSYDLEDHFDSCWTEPAHIEWLERTSSLMRELEIFSEEVLLRTFNEASPLINLISQMEIEKPTALALALRVKNLVWLEEK